MSANNFIFLYVNNFTLSIIHLQEDKMKKDIRVVVVTKSEPRFTPVGQRANEMMLNGIIFNDMWSLVKDTKPKKMEQIILTKYQECTMDYWRIGITQDMVKDILENIFKVSSNMFVLRAVFNICGDVLYATDQDVIKAFTNIIKSRINISSKKYIKKLLRSAHNAFFSMGREYKYEEGDIITYPEVLGNRPLMRNGNPVTEAVRATVIDEWKKVEASRKSRYMVNTIATKQDVKNSKVNIDVKGEEDDEDVRELVRVHKHGLAVSVAIVIFIITELFQELLTDLTRINHYPRLINKANLILMYMFGIHEGCRPGEISQQTTHNNLFMSLGEEYKLLSLVFISSKSLAYLLNSGHLTTYICNFYKGKDKQHYRGRFLSWIPPAYNIIDMATMYIVLMRIIVALDSKALTQNIFKKGLNFSSLRSRTNKRLGIEGMCYYSIRYAAAEDDIKYNIPATWTRYRMGHSAYSNMKNMYANNLNQRVLIENVMTMLGNDLVDEPTNDTIPLKFMEVKGAINHTQIPLDIPQEVIEELKEAKKGISLFMSSELDVKDIPELSRWIPNSVEGLLENLQDIPLGCYITLKEEMLTPTMVSEFATNCEVINRYFAPITQPTTIPMIWSYPQVMYGVWTEKEKEKANKEYRAIQANELLLKMKELIDEAVGAPTSTSKPTLPPANTSVREEIKEMDITNTSDISDDEMEFEGIWKASKIEVGDIVAIVCIGSNVDKWSISIPNTNKHIWLCHVSSTRRKVKPKKIRKTSENETNHTTPYMITGNLYMGVLDNLSYDNRKRQTIEVIDPAIAIILYKKSVHDPKKLKLEEEEINEIFEFVKDLE